MKIIYLFLLLIINLSMNAQSLTGIVYDLETNEPLFNAAIAINQGDQVISGMVTDSLGYFSRKLPAGKYILTCLYLGYESIVKEVLIRDKPVSINFAMEQKAYLSDNAVITARALREPNVTLISKEFFSRIPGAFSDPSRLTIKFPGISGASDQSNEIIVRGLAPHLSSWAINGAPVVNPNHLSNTGTITDVASASGGGVNMISGSSIKSYEFFNNPVNEDYNNVAGGLSNTTLEIPKGLQASLGVLGTEISYGTDKKDFNYGINCRYSTLGILSLIGVPLGDEKINFQDIHVRLYRKKGNRTYSNDFLMGSSSNIHESLGDKSVYYKDALFIKFEGFQIINSLTTGYKINNWESESTLNISAQSNFRFAENDTLIVPAIYPNSEDENQNIVFSMRNQMVYNYSKKIAWKTVIQNRYDLEQRFGRSWGYLQNSSSYLASGLKIRGDRFDLAVFPGISVQDYLVYGDFDDAQFELRASAIYKQKRNRLKLAYSRQSISNNYARSFTSNSLSLDYYINADKLYFQAGVFYNLFTRVPVFPDSKISLFDRIDLFEQAAVFGPLANDGTANQYGLQMQLEYLLFNKLQFISTFSIYDLLVEQGGQEIETSFNFNYTHANTISYKKEIGSKKLLLSLSVQGRGAGYEAVIDENLSKENVNTSYDFTQDKVRTLRPYFRIDTKVDYLWGKELRNRIGLDIQNVTNNQNDAYFYFDPLLDNIQKQQQLGIIPILKYTRKFF